MSLTDLAAHHAGKRPSRASLNLNVSFGMVSIPLAVYASVDDESRTKRSRFTIDGHPIGNMPYSKGTGKPYVGDVVLKVEVATDQWVELTDDEIEAVLGDGLRGVADIETFVPLAAIGREYIVLDVKQVRPRKLDDGKKKVDDPNAAKAFKLLREAMATKQVAGLLKVTLRTVQRYAALTPDGYLLILAYADQVRQDLPLPDPEVSDKERMLAAQLVESVIGVDTPVLVDTDGAKIAEYLASKITDGVIIPAAKDAPDPEPEQDLTALLELAIATAKANRSDVVVDEAVTV